MLDALTRVRRSLASETLIRRNPFVYGRARDMFAHLQRCSIGEREELVGALVRRTLERASNTEYGRQVAAGSNLRDWPLLTKAIVQLAPKTFRSNGLWPVSYASTGGTTGSPLPLTRSLSSLAVEQAAIDFSLQLAGIDAVAAKIAVLRADHVKNPSDRRPPYWTFAASNRRMILSAQHLDRSTVPQYVNAIRAFAPTVLWVYPSALESLCALLQQTKLELTVPCVLSSSEMLSAVAWDLASTTLGCSLVDYYGQAERVAFAVATVPQQFRFLPGYAFVELVPVETDGEHVISEIVGTSLWNDRMPLVRYRTGDLISLPRDMESRRLAEITLGVREFAGITGRSAEYIVTPSGARVVGLNHLPRGVRNLIRLQVIQESERQVTVLVLATPEFSESDFERLHSNIRLKVPESMNVAVRRVQSLESTSVGKCPFVIRRPGVGSSKDEKDHALPLQ